MAKRRLNAKKIANTPLLKKRMAKFCAHFDIMGSNNHTCALEKILFQGHRGYISLSEDDLVKEFDKRLEILKTRLSIKKENDEKTKNDTWYRKDNELIELEIWYEEATSIVNDMFEEQFL